MTGESCIKVISGLSNNSICGNDCQRYCFINIAILFGLFNVFNTNNIDICILMPVILSKICMHFKQFCNKTKVWLQLQLTHEMMFLVY